MKAPFVDAEVYMFACTADAGMLCSSIEFFKDAIVGLRSSPKLIRTDLRQSSAKLVQPPQLELLYHTSVAAVQ